MRAGLPVVASNVGGVTELIDECRTGHLIGRQDSTQLAQSLATLLRDPALRTAMGAAGRAKYERQFAFQRMLEATQDVYHRILHERGCRRAADAARHSRRRRRHRFVHVVESFGAGTAEVISDLTRGIPEYDHVVICGRRSDSALAARRLHPDVKLLPWNGAAREIHPLKDAVAFFDVLRHLRRMRAGAGGGVDVLHAHSAKGGAHGRAAAVVLGLTGRTIYTTHASPVLRQDVGPWTRRLYVALERLGSKLGGNLVACSHSELAHLATLGLRGEVVPNGFEPPAPHRPRSRSAERDADFRPLRICTAGRITSQKDPALFARIARLCASDSAPPLQFTWIGSGELSTELLSSDIRITGWLEQTAVTRELEQAHVYLSTSRWEGLSLGVLRAMALGKPLVLRRCIGNTDVVSHGQNGFLFDTAEQAASRIYQLATDSSLRRRMGEQSLRLVQTSFSRQRMLDAYRRLYGQAAGIQPAAAMPQRRHLPARLLPPAPKTKTPPTSLSAA